MNSGAFIADAEELFVKACYADEGPTLKRFTPRARGRAGRINKRTAHITVIVDRLDDDRIEIVQAREARRTAAGRRRVAAGGTAASRRARVERSRDRAASLKTGDDIEGTDTEVLDDQIEATEVESDTTEESVIETQVEGAEGSASDEAQSDAGDSEADAKEDK